jgi:hypothetical protein
MSSGESGQAWDPKVSARPIMPEDMVPYYESYIPVAAEGHPDREAAAFAALKRRDQAAVESALFPPEPTSNELSDDQWDALLNDLGYDTEP